MTRSGLRYPPARRAGEMLLEAKDQVGHGEWTGWLGRNFHLSHSTAKSYMQLAALNQKDGAPSFSSLSEATRPGRDSAHAASWHAPVREIRVRAARKAGELLQQMAEQGERRMGAGEGRVRNINPGIPKLSDLGVTAKQSALCGKSHVPAGEYEPKLSDLGVTRKEASSTRAREERRVGPMFPSGDFGVLHPRARGEGVELEPSDRRTPVAPPRAPVRSTSR